jgi:uncharacterized protein
VIKLSSFQFGSNGERQLQKRFKTESSAGAFYANQMMDYLTAEMIEFIEHQEMLFISTADQFGNCDSSFRYGKEGFIKVINEKNLMFPDYKGNGVNASLGNIIENSHIGLLIIDFYQNGIGLHINGKASICELEQLEATIEISSTVLDEAKGDRYAERWVAVKVEEAYLHCSKHIPLLKKVDKTISWGTDDAKVKGGDFFKVKSYKKQLNNSN